MNSEVVDEPARRVNGMRDSLVGVNDLPPMSAVLILPALRTWKVADAILFAI